MSEFTRQRNGWMGCYDKLEIRATIGELVDNGDGLPERDGMLALATALYEGGCPRLPGNGAPCPMPLMLSGLRNYLAETTGGRMQAAAAFGRERRRILIGAEHEAYAATIDAAAAEAYYLYGRAYGAGLEFIRQSPGSCGPMQKILQQTARQRGVETQQVYYSGRGSLFFHFYLLGEHEGVRFYIDPTWQQFLPKDVDDNRVGCADVPRTLIVPERMTAQAAQAYGVDERWDDIWSQGKSVPSHWLAPDDVVTRRIFAEQGWLEP